MKSLGFVLIPLLLLSASCSRNNNPDKWILFSKDKKASLYYTFDKKTKTDTNIVKIWVKTVYPGVNHDDPNISYSKNMYMINCSRKTYKINTGFNYSAENEVISKTDVSQTEPALIILDRSNREAAIKPENITSDGYNPIAAESSAERLYSIVCR